MDLTPSPALAGLVEGLILQTFDVSKEEAHGHASLMVSLAEGWGSPEKAPKLDWSYRVKKDLGDKLRWRSEAEREKFQKDQDQRHKSYESFISKSHTRPPWGF